MPGLFLGLLASTGTRLLLWGGLLALWLFTRPGGWAVLAAAALIWAHGLPRH